MAVNPQPIQYPFIGGYRYDFSSVTFTANGAPLPGIQAIDYGNELKSGEIFSNGTPQKVGATRGQLKPFFTFDILALEYENLITALCLLNGTPGSGYMEVRWDVQVMKQDGQGLNLGPLYVDVVRGAKLEKVTKGYKVGQEGLITKCECSCFYVIENGQVPVGIIAGAAGISPTGKFNLG